MNLFSFALQPPVPQTIWLAWNWDPLLLGSLLLAAAVYVRGVRRLWQKAGRGRALGPPQVWTFAGGWLALFVALISPLDRLSSALLSAHMVQHLLLTLAAAPLLAHGASSVALAWGLPRSRSLARWQHRRHERLRRALGAVWRAASRQDASWAANVLVLWLWHIPPLYQAALLDERVHALEHLTFFGAALLFWSAVINARRRFRLTGRRAGADQLSAAFYLFAAAMISGLLGALLTFSQTVWYPVYGILPYAWGLTPLQDQQLAGAIMWFPGGLVYLVALLLLLLGSLQRTGRAGSTEAVLAPRLPPDI